MKLKSAFALAAVILSSSAALPTFASTETHPASPEILEFAQGATDTRSSAAEMSPSELEAHLQAYPYWYALGCARHPSVCLQRARFQGFNYWRAVRDPYHCGYFGLACYGTY